MTAELDSLPCMKTITLRLPDDAYETVKKYAQAESKSMNGWIESVLDREDMRRRCESHERQMSSQPDAVALATDVADRYAAEIGNR